MITVAPGHGLGLGVVCHEAQDGERGIFIEDMAPSSPAERDGRLRYFHQFSLI